MKKKTVVFYDMNCGLCDKTIRFLINRDTENLLIFSPLQGSFAEQHLNPSLTEDLSTYVVLSDERIYVRGAAVKFIINLLNSLIWFRWILFVPTPIVDFGYSIIGKFRYFIFGQAKYCIHLTEDLKSKFYD
ncbi:DCC1-like thiol-disulfide oxidoreductase family protein [Alphaproteobacteria bacterium]|nr:DCC1-like thiol-disulfide oxidoreductase family protein [Alphaproteobacteria bacterium]